jgi:hypothetical protein
MELKNVFNAGRMNKDLDERLVPNGEYVDALNIRVGKSVNGNAGAIENEKGNTLMTFIDTTNNPMTIGSCRDEALERLYWFVVDDNGASFVYEYDNKNDVTSLVLKDTRTGANQVLGFDKKYKITGANVIYNKETKNTLLLFTDNLNPPRMVNVARAKTYGANNFTAEDINLYKRPPRKAPVVTPINSVLEVENNIKERHFAFAYRYKYLDGQYSALSSFTNYQFYPGLFDLDFDTMTNNGMVNEFNAYDIQYNTGDLRVTDIQLCFKTPLSDVIFVIDNINKEDNDYIDNSTRNYRFTNTKVYKALPDDEMNRLFDNVPLKALAQDIINDRVVFGNYTTQYDLLEDEDDEIPMPIDYVASRLTFSQEGQALDFSVTTTSDAATNRVNGVIDFTGVTFRKGYRLFIAATCESFQSGTTPKYYDGDFQGTSSIILTQNYNDATAFYNSQDFDDLLTLMSAKFALEATTTQQANTTQLTYNDFTKVSSTTTSITIAAPTITHQVDNTPSDSTDNDFTDNTEIWRWVEDDTTISFSEVANKLSLKSNRSFDFGLVYLDEDGRYSSVIPNSDDEEKSTIFIPVESSVNINRARLTVKHKPPYWADRFKFFVKTNKQQYYNLYATVFYEQEGYRWIQLTGETAFKVEAGQYLIVKSDDDGPIQNEVKVKVLEVTNKAGNDVVEDTEGWLIGNRDAADDPIKEDSGFFMKIRPNGFTMDFDENNFSTYTGKGRALFGQVNTLVPDLSTPEYGLTQRYNGTSYENFDIPAGSVIKMKFNSWDTVDRDGDEIRYYERQFTVQNDYSGNSTESSFEKWFKSEANWTVDGTTYTDPKDQFNVTFENVLHPSNSSATARRMRVESTETTKFGAEVGKIECTVSLQLTNGVVVFETDPTDIDSDIYFETEQVFDITGGFHVGNNQTQTASQDAICDLTFGNCYSFGNGVESISVRDSRLQSTLTMDLRPNIALLEGFKEVTETNGLIYSGPANENSGYNSLNEFNSARGNTKYMDMKYGSIQRVFGRETDLIVFQEDQVSKVLYGKNMLTGADGSATLTQIEKILGQTVPFAGEFGISKNPESFAEHSGRVYFTDATRGAVLRLGSNGIIPISQAGMSGYFRENLPKYVDNFSYGGFDPKYDEYVLSYNSDAQFVPEFIMDCASMFNKSLGYNQSYTYKVDVGGYPGTFELDYTINSGELTIDITYDGTTNSNTTLTGTGTISTTVTSANLANTRTATVTITSTDLDVRSNFEIEHTCPADPKREVVVMVLNDIDDAGKTIINRWKVNSGNYYTRTDVFSDTGVARNETLIESERNQYMPQDGDTITVSSYREWGVHNGYFNSCSRIGYLVSADAKTTSQVQTDATYLTETSTNNDEYREVTGTFTFSPSATTDILYIIFDYQDGSCTPTDEAVLDEGAGDQEEAVE